MKLTVEFKNMPFIVCLYCKKKISKDFFNKYSQKYTSILKNNKKIMINNIMENLENPDDFSNIENINLSYFLQIIYIN
jgi:hypothetical protein